MIRDILSIRPGECRYCVTPDSPFLFCGEPVAELEDGSKSSYCVPHHRLCHAGFGREIAAIESMIYGMDGSIKRAAADHPNTVPVDDFVRGVK